MSRHSTWPIIAAILILGAAPATAAVQDDPRPREIGIEPGVLPTGPLNAITDVAGVLVGHETRMEGDAIRTGATAVLPHGGNLYEDKVPAGFVQANGYGKFAGTTQIIELGEIETPVILTNTLSVPQGMEAAVRWTLDQPGNENVRSVNAVVGETNDGYLNDIRSMTLTADRIRQAIESATGGPVAEGNVGAGTGTVNFGWKGGIGTSSRLLPESIGGYTVGVLVQTNYGGILSIDGVPIGEELEQYYLRGALDRGDADGSVIVVVATNAPLSDRNLERLARRSLFGIMRTGSPATNGSGDYAVAFSTAESVRRTAERRRSASLIEDLPNGDMSALFQAAVEATEEAVYNALFAAEDMTGHRGRVEELPVDSVRAIMSRYGRNVKNVQE